MFYLSRYGVKTKTPLLEKVGAVVNADDMNKFNVNLTKSDTDGLSGKYIYQITLVGGANYTYQMGQGFCIITRNVNQGG